MRVVFVIPFLVFALSSPAAAGKPKPAAAKTAVAAWAKALVGGNAEAKTGFDAAAQLTSAPFRVLVEDETGVRCDVAIADRAKLVDGLACARNGAAYAPFKPYSPKVLKSLWGKVKAQRAEIEALAKTHVLFVHEERGEDVSELAIVAVASDADGTARVAAVFSSYLTK